MPEYHYVSDDIFTVSEFFSREECEQFIQLAESHGFSDAPINTPFGTEIRRDVRDNTRVMIDDPKLAAHLWGRVAEYMPAKLADSVPVGVNERFRYYRYEDGQQFNWHCDGYFERLNFERSRLTFMVYLNDGFQGGQTSFEGHSIEPIAGMALFFAHELVHKGQPVFKGRKYVLRTDVMFLHEKLTKFRKK